MNKKKTVLILAGIAAVVGYRAFYGLGAFNRIRYKKQYRAILSYTDTHFQDAVIGNIYPSGKGWACNILCNNQNTVLYLLPNDNGGYIFSQAKM